MFGFKTSSAVLLLVFGSVHCSEFKCPAFTKLTPDAFLFMDSEQCDIYWECKQAQPNRKRCPDGLVFHPDKPKGESPCDLKHNVPDKCKHRPAQQRPNPGDAHCPRQNGVYPSEDPSECDVFYSCLNGKGSPTRCAEGLHFSEDLGTCVWPRESGRNGCLSSNERREKKQDSNPSSQTTTAKPQSLPNGFSCPGGSLGVHPALPHPTSCRQYYICLDGITPTEAGCGQGQVFNSRTKKCDQPSNVEGCEDFYDEKAKAKKKELASTVGTTVDSKEFSKFLDLLKMSGVLENGGSGGLPDFPGGSGGLPGFPGALNNKQRPGRPGRRPGGRQGGGTAGCRRKGNCGRKRPKKNKRPRPRPVYYDEYEYSEEDYEDEEAADNTFENNLDNDLEEDDNNEIIQQDNEIQDSGIQEKRKKSSPVVDKFAPLTRFSSQDRKSSFIDRFRPRLSSADTDSEENIQETSTETQSPVVPSLTQTTELPARSTVKDDIDLSSEEAAALFNSLLQDTLETAPDSEAGIPLVPTQSSEPAEADIKDSIPESSSRPSFFPIRSSLAGRRPFSPRRPSVPDTQGLAEDSISVVNTEQPAPESTSSQAFIPTPASKTSRRRPAFSRIPKVGRKEEILAQVPFTHSDEVLTTVDDEADLPVTESLVQMIPMVHKIKEEPQELESALISTSPLLRRRFTFGGSRNPQDSRPQGSRPQGSRQPGSRRPILESHRKPEIVVEEESVAPEVVEEESVAPELEVEEVPRTIETDSLVESQSTGQRRRFQLKSGRRVPTSHTSPSTPEAADTTPEENLVEEDSISQTPRVEDASPTIRRPLRTRTRLSSAAVNPSSTRTTSPSSGVTRPARRRGQIIRKTTTEEIDAVAVTSQSSLEQDTETDSENTRTRERGSFRQRPSHPISRTNSEESNEDMTTRPAAVRPNLRPASHPQRGPQPRRLLTRRPIPSAEESSTESVTESAITQENAPVGRLVPDKEPVPAITNTQASVRAVPSRGREPVSLARLPIPTIREPVRSLPQLEPLQEEPRAISRPQASAQTNNLLPQFRRQQQPSATAVGSGDIFSNPSILQPSSGGGQVTDIFSGTGGAVGLPFSSGTGVPQPPQTPALTPAFQQLTPFQQLRPTAEAASGQRTLFQQLTPARVSPPAAPQQPFLRDLVQPAQTAPAPGFQQRTPPPTQAPVNLPPISVPSHPAPRIPAGFGNFQSFQIFQGPGHPTPINQLTGQPSAPNQGQGQPLGQGTQLQSINPFLSLQASSQNSPAFNSQQFNSGSSFSTFNFAVSPQQQASNQQQVISPFQAALTKLPAGALPSSPFERQQVGASSSISLAKAQPSSSDAGRNSIQPIVASQSGTPGLLDTTLSPEQAQIRKMVTARIRTHLKDLLAENEGDAVEKLREVVISSQNTNRARG